MNKVELERILENEFRYNIQIIKLHKNQTDKKPIEHVIGRKQEYGSDTYTYYYIEAPANALKNFYTGGAFYINPIVSKYDKVTKKFYSAIDTSVTRDYSYNCFPFLKDMAEFIERKFKPKKIKLDYKSIIGPSVPDDYSSCTMLNHINRFIDDLTNAKEKKTWKNFIWNINISLRKINLAILSAIDNMKHPDIYWQMGERLYDSVTFQLDNRIVYTCNELACVRDKDFTREMKRIANLSPELRKQLAKYLRTTKKKSKYPKEKK